MKSTKKLTFSAVLVALGVLFMVLGAVFDILDLSASALASLLVVFAYIEIGAPYVFFVWIATTILSAVFYPGSLMWLSYFLIFGIYPILKWYIERLPRGVWILVKLVYANLAAIAVGFLSSKLLGIELVDSAIAERLSPVAIYTVLLLVANLAFIAFDFFITVMVRFYNERIYPKIKNILK